MAATPKPQRRACAIDFGRLAAAATGSEPSLRLAAAAGSKMLLRAHLRQLDPRANDCAWLGQHLGCD